MSYKESENYGCTKDGFCKVDGLTIKGDALAARLNSIINGMSEQRGTVIGRMAAAAGISVSTVNQILNGSINCPPIRRLNGFARVLKVSSKSLQTSAERDGCNYD